MIAEIILPTQKFRLGRVVITQGAFSLCEERNISALDLVMRHAGGDFGTVGRLEDAVLTDEEKELGALATSDDLKLSALAAQTGQGMVMSVYETKFPLSPRIWVQTLLAGDETYSTVLLPEEY